MSAHAQTFLADTGPVSLVAYESLNGPAWVPGGTGEPSSAHAALQAHISAWYYKHGMSSAADKLPFVMGTAVRELIDGDNVPAGFATQNIINYSVDQTVNGARLDEGRIALGFMGNKLVMIVGTLWSAAKVFDELGSIATMPSHSYSTAKGSVSGSCVQFGEPDPGIARISMELNRKYYRFICDGNTKLVDAFTLAVFDTFPHEVGWAQHPTGVRMNAIRDGNKMSVGTPWIKDDPLVATADVTTWLPIRASYEVISGSTCRFGTSVGTGSWSYIPFPYMRMNSTGPHLVRTGPCSNAGSAFQFMPFTTTRDYFEVSNAYVQLERSAHVARRDVLSGLFSNFAAPSPDDLHVTMYTEGVPSPCAGAHGRYNSFFTSICLNHTMRKYWATAVHEYGHYVGDSYDLRPGLFDSDERRAVIEGVADALNLSIVHRRQFSVNAYTAAELTTLFLTDPGLRRGGWTVNMVTGVNVTDPVHWFGSYNEKGMALPQIMWRLVNDRRCESHNSCNTVSVVSDNTVLPSGVPLDMALYGRRSFTLAMMNDGASENLYRFGRAWRYWLRIQLFNLGLNGASSAVMNVSQVFGQSGVWQ